MLSTFAAVERALTRYTDPLQPRTGSVTALGAADEFADADVAEFAALTPRLP